MNSPSEDWKKVTIKVIHKKGDVGNVRNYPPDLLIACVVQIVTDNSVREIIPSCLTRNKRKIRVASENLTRPLCNVQIDWAEISRVINQYVDIDSWFHEGVRRHHPQINMGRLQILQHRSRSHQLLEEDIQRPTRHLYRQTKRATFSTSRKEPSKVTRCPACCSTRCFSTH